MLLGNFETEFIKAVKSKIEDYTNDYSRIHSQCYERLEKYTSGSIEKHLVKGAGVATRAVGKAIGKIPVIRDSNADEWLIDSGNKLESHSTDIGMKTMKQFSEIREPSSKIFVENLVLVDRIYNNCSDIYIDKENIYLV